MSPSHLGEQIGGRGGDDDQIGLAAQLDMPHLDLVLQVEQIGIDLVLAQRRERQRRDELLPRAGEDAAHDIARFAKQADELDALVRGNAAADDEQDAGLGHRQTPVSSTSSAFNMS